tara:strand:+ start:796 stop:939 length:144 start_codon:yes stop_codon:yes gene_type:complete
MLHRLESKIGFAIIWSTSIKIVANIIKPAIGQFFLQNNFAKRNGARR